MSDMTPFKQKLVEIAKFELRTYGGMDETETALRKRIDDYCAGIGITPPSNVSDFPWSAAFISWCVKEAGASESEFKFSPQHSVFAREAIRNAEQGRGVFRGREIAEYAPQPGDIVQWNRSGGAIDFGEARNNADYPSHSAVVVSFETRGSKRYAVTVGGNENDTIGVKKIELDNSGLIVPRRRNPFICIIEDLKGAADVASVSPLPAPDILVAADPLAPGDQIVVRCARPGFIRVHGFIIEALQSALKGAGFPVVADGSFGNATLAALQAWRQATGSSPAAGAGTDQARAVTAAEWKKLTNSEPPSIFDLCLQLVAAFEGTGFTGAVGNFDGAGITFGVIGYTARHGELSALIEAAKREDPSIVQRAFGNLAAQLELGLAGGTAQRVAFGQSISVPPKYYSLETEWGDAFERFGSEPIVRRLQVERAYRIYWAKARDAFDKYDMQDAQDACLAYDIAVQNGGVKPAADRQIRAGLTSGLSRQQRRLIIAEAVRDASAWKADVFARKSTIATGAGTVHGDKYDLGDWGVGSAAITPSGLAAESAIFPRTSAPAGARTSIGATASFPNARGAGAKPRRLDRREDLLREALTGAAARVHLISGADRKLNGAPDIPDSRDQHYTTSLIDPKLRMLPPADLDILDQGGDGACTGFALSAVINRLNLVRRKNGNGSAGLPQRVSSRMLYELAKQHDEWAGEDYSGSSLRGALKGFFHNGVCSEQLSPYDPFEREWCLAVGMAKEARNVGLGAYFRLKPNAIDYHAALNEVGVVCVSARVHKGWRDTVNGEIQLSKDYIGGHAFAIVGYDENGFFVQNSWGPTWGGGGACPPGVALWTYEDWAENILDAWVLRLSVPTPKAFDVVRAHSGFALERKDAARATVGPRRSEVNGHIININDGVLQEKGSYATPFPSLVETAKLIADRSLRYDHVMFYAHGGLNSLDQGAARAAALIEPFKRNGIYPVFWLWGTDALDVGGEVLNNIFRQAFDKVGGVIEAIADVAIEKTARAIARPIWRQIQRDAEAAFASRDDTGAKNGLSALRALCEHIPSPSEGGPQMHFLGHSAGSILMGHALAGLARDRIGLHFATAHLMAPACTIDFFNDRYQPALTNGALEKLSIYNLTDEAERRDGAIPGYSKSLLYLVSRACEGKASARLLGMQDHLRAEALPPEVRVDYADVGSPVSASTTHGGFDNDLATMNTILDRVLGRPADPDKRLREQELGGY